MKLATAFLTGIAVFSLAPAAQSAPALPAPTGRYIFVGQSLCEARFNPTTRTYAVPGGGSDVGVKTIGPAQAGLIASEVGYITFTPSAAGASSGAVVLGGRVTVEGGSLRIGDSVFNMTQQGEPKLTGTYSFTATTFTITIDGSPEGPLTFAMVYTGGALARTVYLTRKESSTPPCLNTIMATK